MTDADGATLTLADFKGKPVLLNFWPAGAALAKARCPTSRPRGKSTALMWNSSS